MRSGFKTLGQGSGSQSRLSAFKLHTHEKAVAADIVELRRLKNICTLLNQKSRHAVHNAWSVGARKAEDELWLGDHKNQTTKRQIGLFRRPGAGRDPRWAQDVRRNTMSPGLRRGDDI